MTGTLERREVPPRENLLRLAPFTLRADADVDRGDGLTLDGFAAVFNRLTLIDSWEGRFWEEIAPGSMKKSFREKPPKIQFDHGQHPLIGSIPIAKLITAEEASDPELAPDGGAHIVGRLFDNWLIQPVRDAIAEQAIDGQSFRFSVVREAWFEADGTPIRDEDKLREILRRSWYEDVPETDLARRVLKELRVPETGPVVWPAYNDTSVGVRSRTLTIDLGRLGDPEQQKLLAEAVLFADSATRTTTDAPPPDQDPADEHPDPESAPPAADDSSPGEHPSSSPATEDDRATDPQEEALRAILAKVRDAREVSIT